MTRLFCLMLFGLLLGAAAGRICRVEPRADDRVVPRESQKPSYRQPDFIEVPAVSKPDLRLVETLADIRSHISDGGYYNDTDLVTAAHETTHGINSNIRNSHYRGSKENGFYCLGGRGVLLPEPRTTIQRVARSVPPSLRGSVYRLYLVEQASGWGDRPLYLMDEWVSYTHGSMVRRELGLVRRDETVQYMMEFDVYVLEMLRCAKEDDPGYDMEPLVAFVRWNLLRSMDVYKGEEGASRVLSLLRDSSDAESLRRFARETLGSEWCSSVMGF